MTNDQYQSIYDDLNLSAQYFTWKIKNTSQYNTLEEFIDAYIDNELYGDEESEKILALMEHTGDTYSNAQGW